MFNFTIFNIFKKLFVYFILLLVFINLYLFLTLVYEIITTRTKIIRVKNIIYLLGSKYLIDFNDNSYVISKHKVFNDFNILDHMNTIEINKEYEIYFYGFNTYFTEKKIFYFKLNE